MVLAIVIVCFGPHIYFMGYIQTNTLAPNWTSAASWQSKIVFSHDWLGHIAASLSWKKKECDARWIMKSIELIPHLPGEGY